MNRPLSKWWKESFYTLSTAVLCSPLQCWVWEASYSQPRWGCHRPGRGVRTQWHSGSCQAHEAEASPGTSSASPKLTEISFLALKDRKGVTGSIMWLFVKQTWLLIHFEISSYSPYCHWMQDWGSLYILRMFGRCLLQHRWTLCIYSIILDTCHW